MTSSTSQTSKLSPEERRVLMKYFDDNGDGRLSGPELMDLMRKTKEEISSSASKLPDK
jgi:Ca2+-binding EF-hand superfamily protein